DERQRFLSLTPKGRRVFRPLDKRSDHDVAAMIAAVPPAERNRLIEAVETVRTLLGDETEPAKTPYLLRLHQPGDMGWIVSRQAILYVEEYGWDGTYEARAGLGCRKRWREGGRGLRRKSFRRNCQAATAAR